MLYLGKLKHFGDMVRNTQRPVVHFVKYVHTAGQLVMDRPHGCMIHIYLSRNVSYVYIPYANASLNTIMLFAVPSSVLPIPINPVPTKPLGWLVVSGSGWPSCRPYSTPLLVDLSSLHT